MVDKLLFKQFILNNIYYGDIVDVNDRRTPEVLADEILNYIDSPSTIVMLKERAHRNQLKTPKTAKYYRTERELRRKEIRENKRQELLRQSRGIRV